MPYLYNKSQVLKARWLERVAWVILLPLALFQRPRNSAPHKILLIEPFQMGDVLSLTPLIDPLIHKFPEAEIIVLTKSSSGSILDYDSRVSKVLKLDFSWSDYGVKGNKISRVLRMLRSIVKLRNQRFDIGIDTRGDVRSQVLLLLTGCRARIGYRNYLHSNLTLSGLLLTRKIFKSKHLHRYNWNLELLSLVGVEESDLFPIKFPTYKPDRLPSSVSGSEFMLIHVGGGWEFKRWKEYKWIKLINHLRLSSDLDIVVIGGPSEKDIVKRIEEKVLPQRNIRFATTTLEELIGLIIACKQFVGLDSGPMNLAVCLGKPVISLFGPGDSVMWYPLSAGSKSIHFKEKFPCNPCFQTICYFPQSNCMDEIEVVDVINLVNSK